MKFFLIKYNIGEYPLMTLFRLVSGTDLNLLKVWRFRGWRLWRTFKPWNCVHYKFSTYISVLSTFCWWYKIMLFWLTVILYNPIEIGPSRKSVCGYILSSYTSTLTSLKGISAWKNTEWWNKIIPCTVPLLFRKEIHLKENWPYWS